MSRRDVLEVVFGDYQDEWQEAALDDYVESKGDDMQQFALVERNWRGSREYWLTLHDTLQDAGSAHVDQEYAEDWELIEVRDLDTGDTYEGTIQVIWAKRRS